MHFVFVKHFLHGLKFEDDHPTTYTLTLLNSNCHKLKYSHPPSTYLNPPNASEPRPDGYLQQQPVCGWPHPLPLKSRQLPAAGHRFGEDPIPSPLSQDSYLQQATCLWRTTPAVYTAWNIPLRCTRRVISRINTGATRFDRSFLWTQRKLISTMCFFL